MLPRLPPTPPCAFQGSKGTVPTGLPFPLPGGDLYSALRRHPEALAWGRLGRKVALDVALGLNYLHRWGRTVVEEGGEGGCEARWASVGGACTGSQGVAGWHRFTAAAATDERGTVNEIVWDAAGVGEVLGCMSRLFAALFPSLSAGKSHSLHCLTICPPAFERASGCLLHTCLLARMLACLPI